MKTFSLVIACILFGLAAIIFFGNVSMLVGNIRGKRFRSSILIVQTMLVLFGCIFLSKFNDLSFPVAVLIVIGSILLEAIILAVGLLTRK